MNSQQLLQHLDEATLWQKPQSDAPKYDLKKAYQDAKDVRQIRLNRGEIPKGYKIGFTNRTIWQRYNVSGPIWGTVWDATLSHFNQSKPLSLSLICQPRIEPEIVFSLSKTPPKSPTLQQLFECIDWIAPCFEIVQCHLPDWKFQIEDTVADCGLHAHLKMGHPIPIQQIAPNAEQLHQQLSNAQCQLFKNNLPIDSGKGSYVLDSPLHAFQFFLEELRHEGLDIQAHDVVTTGTWTDAYAVQSGEHWHAEFSFPSTRIDIEFSK